MHSSIYLYRRGNIQNQEEKASGIMIIPRWVTQVWFPKMAAILGDSPILLPSNILNLPFTDSTNHLLYPKLKLLAADLSGKPSDTQTLQQTLTIKSQNEDSYRYSFMVCTLMVVYVVDYVLLTALPRAVTVNGYIKLPKHLLLSRYLKEIYNRHPL